MGDITAGRGPKRKTHKETQRDIMALLTGEDAPEQGNAAPSAHNALDITELVPYANHPFALYEGVRLDDMVRSIRENGVIVPIIVRPLDDLELEFEILSGHNRVNAAKIAGLTKVPAVIMHGLSDEDAKLIVTETNLNQRSFADLSHSQRAIALKHHMDAVKAQGKRNDLIKEIEMLSNPDEIKENGTCSLLGNKSKSLDKTGAQYGLSKNSVARYVRIAALNISLQKRIDNDEIGLYPAVSLSYLTADEQEELERQMDNMAYKVDMKKAESLRELSADGKLTPEKMRLILSGELNKKPKVKNAPPFKLKAKIYQKYFDGDSTQSEIEATIDQALAEYFNKHKEVIA